MNWISKIPIGQYVDGDNSWLRVIDLRIKLICLFAFLVTPILSGWIYRITLVFVLLIVTFISRIPSRVWWRSVLFLLFFSVFIGIITLLVSSGENYISVPIRDPNELNIELPSSPRWELLNIKVRFLSYTSPTLISVSRKSAILAIKTSTLFFTVIHSVNLLLITTRQEDIMWGLNYIFRTL